MSGKFLLDTNIVIALFANDENVLAQLKIASEVFIPSIVLGELHYGANKSNRSQTNITRIEEFAGENQILAADAETARHYGKVKNALHVKGKPIPENDIWIAALSIQHQCTLVTQDNHFSEVAELETISW
jgi:tRNA(fMet)-specific endonuclease VapC